MSDADFGCRCKRGDLDEGQRVYWRPSCFRLVGCCFCHCTREHAELGALEDDFVRIVDERLVPVRFGNVGIVCDGEGVDDGLDSCPVHFWVGE